MAASSNKANTMAWPFGPCWPSKSRNPLTSYGVTLSLWVLACACLDFDFIVSVGGCLRATQWKTSHVTRVHFLKLFMKSVRTEGRFVAPKSRHKEAAI